MEQKHGTTPSDAPEQAPQDSRPDDGQQVETPAAAAGPPAGTGFGSRGRIRRRARFLRKARELAYRDLGGLVFNLHRFGQRNDELVLAKLNLLGQIDDELRTLENALRKRQPVTVLREAGITACPRCAAIHSSEDRFCPNCGLSMGKHPDLPIAGAPAAAGPAGQPAAAPARAVAAGPAQPASAAPGGSPASGAPEPATAVHAAQPPPASTASPVPASPRGQSEGGAAPTREHATAQFPSLARTADGRSPTPPQQAGSPGATGHEGGGADRAETRAGAADGDTEVVRPPAQSP